MYCKYLIESEYLILCLSLEISQSGPQLLIRCVNVHDEVSLVLLQASLDLPEGMELFARLLHLAVLVVAVVGRRTALAGDTDGALENVEILIS